MDKNARHIFKHIINTRLLSYMVSSVVMDSARRVIERGMSPRFLS
jgi:hypothetical protein